MAPVLDRPRQVEEVVREPKVEVIEKRDRNEFYRQTAKRLNQVQRLFDPVTQGKQYDALVSRILNISGPMELLHMICQPERGQSIVF